MLDFLKKIFGYETKKTMSLEEFISIKQEYLELCQITNTNVRYLQSSINVAKAMINSYGIRYAKRKKPFVDELYKKLNEEEYYVKLYERMYDTLEQGRIPTEISSQY